MPICDLIAVVGRYSSVNWAIYFRLHFSLLVVEGIVFKEVGLWNREGKGIIRAKFVVCISWRLICYWRE